MSDFLQKALATAPDLHWYAIGGWFVLVVLIAVAVIKNRGLGAIRSWVRDLEKENLEEARRLIKAIFTVSKKNPDPEEICNDLLVGNDQWRRAQLRVSARLGRIRRGKISLVLGSFFVLLSTGLSLSKYCESVVCSGATIAAIVSCIWLLIETGPLFWLALTRRPPK